MPKPYDGVVFDCDATLSALEAHQGRKVGVVSHTEQIRSQISPQIRVIKCGGDGRSRIEVK